MHFFIDSANLEEIRRIDSFIPITGVTTNPSLIAKQNQQPISILEEIRRYVGERELHAQVVSLQREEMIKEAQLLSSKLGEKTCIKIPVCPEGFAAMKQLAADGFSITATAVFTPLQAMLAVECGAVRIAPYVSRIDKMGYDGLAVAERIQTAFDKNGISAGIVAASVKNLQQVERMCEIGVYAVTLAPEMYPAMTDNPGSIAAAQEFHQKLKSLI